MNYSKLERNIATEKQFLKSQTCPPSLPLLGKGCLLFLVCTTFNETGFRTDFKKSLATKSTRHCFISQDTSYIEKIGPLLRIMCKVCGHLDNYIKKLFLGM